MLEGGRCSGSVLQVPGFMIPSWFSKNGVNPVIELVLCRQEGENV